MIQIHHKLSSSRTNGPGNRAVIWVQGCTLNCPGCFNPKTHVKNAGSQSTVNELFEWIFRLDNGIEGITLSGGEPLQQAMAVLSLLQRIKKETNLSTFMFSGYTRAEIETFPVWPELSECLDVLICGRYDQTQKHDHGIIRSANQEALFLSDRYTQQDLDQIPENELIIMPDGEILVSGVGGIQLK
jgi:anaerobic ribonucleoside-triphosphate reductase activating protein